MASRGVRVAGDLGRLGCEAVRYQCELEEQYEQHTERLEAKVSASYGNTLLHQNPQI